MFDSITIISNDCKIATGMIFSSKLIICCKNLPIQNKDKSKNPYVMCTVISIWHMEVCTMSYSDPYCLWLRINSHYRAFWHPKKFFKYVCNIYFIFTFPFDNQVDGTLCIRKKGKIWNASFVHLKILSSSFHAWMNSSRFDKNCTL